MFKVKGSVATTEDSETGTPKIFYTPMTQHHYSVAFTSDIEEPSFYDSVIHLLLTAEEGTTIDFLISSYGGRLDSTVGIRGALQATKAHVTGYLLAQSCSAAGMLFLCCHSWVVNEFATFHAHTASYGSYGKSDDVKQQVDYVTTQTERIVRSVYDSVLSKEEQDLLLSGKEFYFDDIEITKRLKYREDVRAQEAERIHIESQNDLSEFTSEQLEDEVLACREDIKLYQKELKSRNAISKDLHKGNKQ